MTRVRVRKDNEADLNTIIALTLERDEAVACLEKIKRMRKASNMREEARLCLRDIERGRTQE